MKPILFILFLSILVISSQAQKMPDLGLNKIRIVENGHTILLETRLIDSDPEIYTDRLYYWYSSNHVHTTQGGFSGKLLNGNYAEFFDNKELKEQGIFRKGLKNGVWKRWNEQGHLLMTATWRNGIQSGAFESFDTEGHPKQSGTYKNGLLEGKIKTFTKDSVITEKYQAGQLIIPVKKRPFLQRLPFIGHKKSATKKAATP